MKRQLSEQHFIKLRDMVVQQRGVIAKTQYRDFTGSDLLEAHTFIEALEDEINIINKGADLVKGHNYLTTDQLLELRKLLNQADRTAAINMYMKLKYPQAYDDKDFIDAGTFMDNLLSREDIDISKSAYHQLTPSTITDKIKQQQDKVEKTKSEFTTIDWLPVNTAPLFIEKLIDPDIPLEDSLNFIPIEGHEKPRGRFFNKIYFIVHLLFTLIMFFGIYQILFEPRLLDLLYSWAIFIFSIAILAAGSWWLWRNNQHKQQEAKHLQELLKSGKYRQGMFVLSEGIVLHKRESICYVPKNDIEKFTLILRGRTSENKKELNIHAKDQEDKLWNINLDFLNHQQSDQYRSRNLINALTIWLNTGKWSQPDQLNYDDLSDLVLQKMSASEK